ncbi:MAG: 50S ribosomal protein L25, partial [Pseudobdellovibrionaceae bacterium]
LGVGDALHVSDVKVPSTVKVLSSSDLTIAVVNLFVEEAAAPTVEAAAPAAGAAAPAAGAAAPAAGAAAAPAAGAKKDAPKK